MSPLRRTMHSHSRGQGVTEYVIILSVIALIVIVLVTQIGKRTSNSLCQVSGAFSGGAGGQMSNLGYNADGELGDGGTTSRGWQGVSAGCLTQIASGYTHTLGLKSDGTVVAWGSNVAGELGNGGNTANLTPTLVPGLANITYVSAAYQYSAALRNDGTVWVWGDNSIGQAGNGALCAPAPCGAKAPTMVNSLTGITAISAGRHYMEALKADGSIVAWGQNNAGQLGIPDLAPRYAPTANGVSGIRALGGSHQGDFSVVLKNDGTLVSWGDNIAGELGNGTSMAGGCHCNGVPGPVSSLTGITAVATGFYYAYALKSDGTVASWGGSDNGQLGNNTTCVGIPCVGSTTPVAVSVITGVTGISTNNSSSYALKNDGTVWSWGSNGWGELGHTPVSQNVPEQIPGLPTVTASFAGGQGNIFILSRNPIGG